MSFIASTRQPLKWFAVKGSTSNNLRKDFINRPETDKRYGVRVIEFGTHMGKDRLASHYAVDLPGPGYVNIPEKLGDEKFLSLMTAEHRRETIVGGRRVNKWMPKKTSIPSEVFDCMLYALGMALTLDYYWCLGLSSMESVVIVPKHVVTEENGSTVVKQSQSETVTKSFNLNNNNMDLQEIMERMAS